SSIFAVAFLWLGEGLTFAKITPDQAKTLPPPANHKIDFPKEIKPIFEASCIKCHGRGRTKGDLSIESRDTLLKGGESGPAIVPGKSEESRVIELVAGLDPDSVMPQKGKRLTPEQIGLLRAWIDQGAPWDASISFAKPPPVNLLPRKPELPAARQGIVNPIDRILRPYYKADGLDPRKPVSDRNYARRVYLDAIGLLPTPESAGFAQGIVWRGVVNASQTPQMQAAQNISQVFMGVNLKCASCHDSFINDWMLSDSYGLAGIYSDEPLEMVHCDKPTGHF